ncbi:MAG: beta-ketoacyl-ACP synthase III [Bacteroidales bacterium]
MKKYNAVITGVGFYVPDYVLTNQELTTMVDTTDEWIMTRIGVKERRILKEEGAGTSYLAAESIKNLLAKSGVSPQEIDCVICATSTPDHRFPSTASIAAEKCGIKNAFSFDLSAACSGFIYGLDVASGLISTGRYKKILLVGAEKMSSMVDYTDRATCPIFGDGAGAVLLEPTEEEFGVMDSALYTDGIGYPHLQMKAGGSVRPASHETVDQRLHYVYQEGQVVFKYAVSKMAEASAEILQRNNLTQEDVSWFVPHQANMRIIEAAQKRMGLPREKVMVNIEKYGNTSAATLPICLAEYESKLRKGDNIILAAFGAGFTWGATFLKWGYDPK